VRKNYTPQGPKIELKWKVWFGYRSHIRACWISLEWIRRSTAMLVMRTLVVLHQRHYWFCWNY